MLRSPGFRSNAKTLTVVLMALLAVTVGAADIATRAVHTPAVAAEAKKKAIDPKAAGEVYEWTSAGGVVCSWRAPAKYDAATGVNLTLILHGSNLSHLWGFANHDAKTFRPDDFVLVPDGTTAAPAPAKNAFNFLEGDTRKMKSFEATQKTYRD
ncbi:MAG: hypothetical protein K8T90_02660 [Planctomycetes bacterium]|nr:hypothetical protein [Planctomycetota bacterium]